MFDQNVRGYSLTPAYEGRHHIHTSTLTKCTSVIMYTGASLYGIIIHTLEPLTWSIYEPTHTAVAIHEVGGLYIYVCQYTGGPGIKQAFNQYVYCVCKILRFALST